MNAIGVIASAANSASPDSGGGNHILTEDGDAILTEAGDKIVTET